MRPIAKALGILLIVLALAGIAYPIWWNHRSSSEGNALIAQATSQLTLARPQTPSTCPTSTASAMAPTGSGPGILEVPSIGLVAPVLNGVTDAVLNVAAGHDPSTNWPGTVGESIVLAHDVSYFASLSRIQPGATVLWLTPCGRAQFQVVNTAVRTPGALVYTPANGAGLALVTCYPTNALFWTPSRFVVTTKLISTQVVKQTLPNAGAATPHLKVSIPSALAAEGLQLDQNSLYMGVMQLAGTPSPSFVNGPGPLLVEAQALEVFFGAEKSVLQKNKSWWSTLSLHGLQFRQTWPTFSQADVTINVSGTKPKSVTISSGTASAEIVNVNNTLYLAKVTG